MGTINFKTSKYITMGVKPYDAAEVAKDPEFMDYISEYYPGEDPERMAAEEISGYYDADRENVESILKKYSFEYFNIEVIPGYYESLQIFISDNLPLYFDDYTEKREALKEVTKLKALLKDAAGVGFVACFPSWATAYSNYKETLTYIEIAAGKMRDEIKTAETWRTRQKKKAV